MGEKCIFLKRMFLKILELPSSSIRPSFRGILKEFKVSRTVGCWLQKLLQLLTSNRLQLLTNSILPEFVGRKYWKCYHIWYYVCKYSVFIAMFPLWSFTPIWFLRSLWFFFHCFFGSRQIGPEQLGSGAQLAPVEDSEIYIVVGDGIWWFEWCLIILLFWMVIMWFRMIICFLKGNILWFLSDPGIPGSDNANRAIQGNVGMQVAPSGDL